MAINKLWLGSPDFARLAIGLFLLCISIGVLAADGASAESNGSDAQDTGRSGLAAYSGKEDYAFGAAAISRVETRRILTDFYHATDGDNWENNTNWLSTKPIRTWFGVTATASDRIEQLVLRDNLLSGQIPPEMGKLSALRVIDLAVNDLTGPIPPELGMLSSLGTLSLADNLLTGIIPPELGNASRLADLRLEGNSLTGRIPPELGKLTRLNYLSLTNNLLSGPIPPELGKLVRLEILLLNANRLTGSIPPEFGKLTKLVNLWLHRNLLTGPIPAELGNTLKLTQFFASENRLSGTLPAQLHAWVQLEWLVIGGNNLAGCLPSHWAEVTYGDISVTGLNYCPFGLPHLSAGQGALDPEFDSEHHDYVLTIGIETDEITLDPISGQGNVAIRNNQGRSVRDADLNLGGHQIRLTRSETEFVFTIEYSEDLETAEYRVSVIRGFPGRLTVLDNESPGVDHLDHNIPNLEVTISDQVLAADFLSHFRRTGGIERWGFATSEVLVLEDNTLTQFYQRGVVDFHNLGSGWVVERRLAWDYVGGGRGGSVDLGVEPGTSNPHPGIRLGPWGHKVSNFAVGGEVIGFADFFERLGGVAALGLPKSEAREDTGADGTLHFPGGTLGFIRQYFQSAVLEFHPSDPNFPVKLTLLGDTLRSRLVPNHEQFDAFAPAQELAIGGEYVPWLVIE